MMSNGLGYAIWVIYVQIFFKPLSANIVLFTISAIFQTETKSTDKSKTREANILKIKISIYKEEDFN